MTMIETCIRNLTRSFLACSHVNGKQSSAEERADTEQAVRTLLAMIYAAKNHLRAEWGTGIVTSLLDKSTVDRDRHRRESTSVHRPEYEDLLPSRIRGYEDQGLGLLLQLSINIEGYIKRAHDRGWFHSPQASQMTVQLNQLVAAYGSMETIHLTPIPVAYLIHMRQVLALFGGVLPFALVEEMGWYAVVLVSLVMFTLYGKLVSLRNNIWFAYADTYQELMLLVGRYVRNSVLAFKASLSQKCPHRAVISILTMSFCSSKTHSVMTERISKWMQSSRISGCVQSSLAQILLHTLLQLHKMNSQNWMPD